MSRRTSLDLMSGLILITQLSIDLKNSNEEKFLSDVEEADFSFKTINSEENYLVLTNVFSNIVNVHAPLKKKSLEEMMLHL